MKKKSKGLLFGGIGLLVCVPLIALTTTSCSSTPSPLGPNYSIKVGSNNFTCSNGTVYQEGNNSFGDNAGVISSFVGGVSAWAYGFATSLSQLISRSPTTKDQQNLINLPPSVVNSGLDFALGSYLGSGSNTYRLGISSIIFSSDFASQANGIIKPNGQEISDPGSGTQLSLGTIEINYSWWKSNGGNSTSYISESTFNSINKEGFKNSKLPPKLNYSLKINATTIKVNPSYSKDGEKFISTGGLTIIPPYTINGINDDTFRTNMDYLIKVAQGDEKDIIFKQALEKPEGVYINENISKIIP